MTDFDSTLRRLREPGPASGAPERDDPVLAEPGEIRWEGAIFERVTSIERQLDALEEGLGKRVPELESRLLHLLERRLGALETDIHRRVSDLATDVALDADQRRRNHRRLLWALAGLGILILIF